MAGSRSIQGSVGRRASSRVVGDVFEFIVGMVEGYRPERAGAEVRLVNDSKREVLVEVGECPDIRVVSRGRLGTSGILSIEVVEGGARSGSLEAKEGGDMSAVINGVMEAEKNHLEAKGQGIAPFWTIIDGHFDPEIVKRLSPTTSLFFHLGRLRDEESQECREFSEWLGIVLGVRI